MKDKEKIPSIGTMFFFKFILKRLFISKAAIISIIAFIIYEVTYGLAVPFLYQVLFDDVIPNKNFSMLLIIAVILIGGLIILTLFVVIRAWLISLVGTKFIGDLRYEMISKLNMGLLPKDFKKSEYLQSFNADMAILEYYICHQAFNIIGAALSTVLGIILLFTISWALSITILLIIAIIIPVSSRLSKKIDPYNRKKTTQESKLNLTADECVSLNEATYSLNLGKHWNNIASKAIKKMFNPSRKFHLFSDATSFIPGILIGIVITTLLIIGSTLTILGHFTVGELIAFVSLFALVGSSAGLVMTNLPLINQARLALSHILPYIQKIEQKKITNNRDGFKDKITITNASFSYDGKTQHLNDISLEIKKGDWVAFIGSSGSGKSTLLKLILGFIEPHKGSVKIDGADISQMTKNSHFQDSRVVFQKPKLYTASIKENIRLAHPKATDQEIIDVCKQAQVHDNIMNTPDQYDTIVGKEGESGLSGGQLQRIAIARALVSHPEIMYLDEATSALDPKSVTEILNLIEKSRGKQTFLHVCHDLRKIQTCDKIVVMHKGKMLEVGNHQELLANEGKYDELWNIQQGVAVDESDQEFEISEEILRSIPLLSDLPSQKLKSLGENFDVQHAKMGDVIIQENTLGQNFFIIASGKVLISKTIDDQSIELNTLEIGDFFGEISLIQHSMTTAAVTAKEYCVLLRLSKSKFDQFINSLSASQKKIIDKAIKDRLAAQKTKGKH